MKVLSHVKIVEALRELKGRENDEIEKLMEKDEEGLDRYVFTTGINKEFRKIKHGEKITDKMINEAPDEKKEILRRNKYLRDMYKNIINVIGSVMDIEFVPGKAVLEAKKKYYDELIKKRGGVDKLTNEERKARSATEFFYKHFKNNNTACVFPTIVRHSKGEYLKAMIFMSNDFLNQIHQQEPNDLDFLHAVYTTIEHEMQHVFRHHIDLPSGIKGKIGYPDGLSNIDDNIFYDLEINASIMKQGGKKDFFEKNKLVYSKTIAERFAFYDSLIRAIKESESFEEMLQNFVKYKTEYGEKFNFETNPDEVTQIARAIEYQKSKEKLKNVDLDSVIKNALTGSTYEKLNKDKIDMLFTNKNLVDVIYSFIKNYETNPEVAHAFDMPYLATLYRDLSELLEFKPQDGENSGGEDGGDGGGRGRQKPGKPSDDDKRHHDIQDEDFEDEMFDEITEEIKDGFKDDYMSEFDEAVKETKEKFDSERENRPYRPPTRGSKTITIPLEPLQTETFTNILRKFFTDFRYNLCTHIEEDVDYDYYMTNPSLTVSYQKQVEQMEKQLGIWLPKTVIRGMEDVVEMEKPINSIVIGIVDESGSMSDKEVAIAKNALLETCASEKSALLLVSIDDNNPTFSNAQYSLFLPDMDKKEFLQRYHSGGTGDFHRFLFNLEEILKDEKTVEKLEEGLKGKMSIKDLLNAKQNFSLGMIVVTDGGLFEEKNFKDEWLEYAKNFYEVKKMAPIMYVNVNTNTSTFYDPFSHIPEKNKIREIKHIKNLKDY